MTLRYYERWLFRRDGTIIGMEIGVKDNADDAIVGVPVKVYFDREYPYDAIKNKNSKLQFEIEWAKEYALSLMKNQYRE